MANLIAKCKPKIQLKSLQDQKQLLQVYTKSLLYNLNIYKDTKELDTWDQVRFYD